MSSPAATDHPPTTPGELGPPPPKSVGSLGSFILLTLRIGLGGIFCLAATLKLMNPQTFWEAINAFKATNSEEMKLMGTHTLPWIELFAGLALALGFWTREAAFIIGSLLLVFIWAVINAIHKDLGGLPCSCLGYWHLVCTDGVGWCKVRENGVLTAIAATLVVTGGGSLSLDRLLCRPSPR